MGKKWKSASLLGDFAEAVPADEIELHLCGPIWRRMKTFTWRKTLHIHHVFHAGTRKDLWWNLVRASEAAHTYCHKEPVGGMLACMWAIILRANRDDVPRDEVFDGPALIVERGTTIVVEPGWRLAYSDDLASIYVRAA